MADQLLDASTGLPFQIKRPGESRIYEVDCSPIMKTGITVASVQSVTVRPAGLTVGTGTPSGVNIQFNASGGIDGQDYEVTLTFTDSAGNNLEDDIMLKVRKAGALA